MDRRDDCGDGSDEGAVCGQSDYQEGGIYIGSIIGIVVFVSAVTSLDEP